MAAYNNAMIGISTATISALPPNRFVDQNDGSEDLEAPAPALTSESGLVVAAANGLVVVAVVVAVVGAIVVGPPLGDACSSGTWVYCSAFGAPRVGVGSNSTHPCPPMYTSGHAWACSPRT